MIREIVHYLEFIKNGELYYSSVGDSSVSLLRNGVLTQLNREHTLKIELDEKAARGEISFEEAQSDSQRNALTSYIGIDGELQRDYNSEAIGVLPGDRLLLMTDGVFGTVSNEEIAAIVSGSDIYNAGIMLENAIVQKGKPNQDNYTAIILKI